MSARRRVFAGLGLCVSLWAAPAPADAAREVRVAIAADAADAKGLETVFRELLARLKVSLVVTRTLAIEPTALASPGRAEPGLLTRVWVDLTKPGAASLYLLDVRTDRVLVRKIRRDAGGSELAQEELGHILQTSVEGLLAGDTVGVPRQEILPLLQPDPESAEKRGAESTANQAPERAKSGAQLPDKAATTAQKAYAPAWLHGQATLLYSAGLFGPEALFSHGPELGIFAHTNGRVEPGLWLRFQWHLPVRVATGPVSARFSRLSPRGLFTLKLIRSGERTLRLGLGAGADVVRVETTSDEGAEISVEAPSTRVFAIARAALLFDWRLSTALRLALALDLDVDGSGARYVFSARTGERSLLEPYALRPALALGVSSP